MEQSDVSAAFCSHSKDFSAQNEISSRLLDRKKFEELQNASNKSSQATNDPQTAAAAAAAQANNVSDISSFSSLATAAVATNTKNEIAAVASSSSSSSCDVAAHVSSAESEKTKTEADAVAQELIQWLETNGADTKKLMLQQYAPEVRGVHSKKTLVPGERILAIPKKCLITVEMGQATDIGQKLVALNYDFVAPKHIYLMMFLLTDMENV